MKLTPKQIAQIREVPHFRDSHYCGWDLQRLVDFYNVNFILPNLNFLNERSRISDIGCGYGWLSICIALNTGAAVYALEADEARLHAARAIADILGVADKIFWIVGSADGLPIMKMAVDIVFCIEVIEHVGHSPKIVHELSETCKDTLVITTPNGALPIVFHDTALPFCHWLPKPVRDKYAALFRRSHKQDDNHFWTAWQIWRAAPKFRLATSWFACLKPNLRMVLVRVDDSV